MKSVTDVFVTLIERLGEAENPSLKLSSARPSEEETFSERDSDSHLSVD